MQRAEGIDYATVDLSEADYRGFYVNFANGVLWPLLHFRLGLMTFRSEDYETYRSVNQQFARALAPMLQPDDIVWVHDYHLIPLAEELRNLGVRNRIGFFLHTPFVPPAIMQALPRASELLCCLCAYDVAGFHTEGYQRAFLDCVHEMLGGRPDADGRFLWRGQPVHAVTVPVGIDADGFARTAERAAQTLEARQLRDSLSGRHLAIGVDRLDYSKGLVSRFEAIGRLFAHYPDQRRQVTFLQIAARSREDQGDYQRLRRELDRIVGDTNGRYSEFDWVPLRYLTRTVRRNTLAGFYRIARLGVVTPLRDGMNLVAKEYVAAQDPADPGVLILSRFAGAADSMPDALIVNPFDAEEVAAAMHRGINMELTERRRRWEALREAVWSSTAAHYCSAFLAYLDASNGREPKVAFRAAS